MIIKPGTLVFYRNEEYVSLYVPENILGGSWEGGHGTTNSQFVYVLNMNTDCGFKQSFA